MSKSRPHGLLDGIVAVASRQPDVKWPDEDTQKAPLSVPQAQWASDDELDVLLGAMVWHERRALKNRVAHWMAHNNLLGLVDTQAWRAALRPWVLKQHLAQSAFVLRPASAATPPEGFRLVPLDDLLWKFGLHGADSPRELPSRLLRQPLTLQQMPRLSPGLLAPRHLRLMRLLGAQPLSYAALGERLQANADDLHRDLTALYLTRAIGPG